MEFCEFEKIKIVDSTLREGEQCAKVYFDPIEKFIILKQLLKLPIHTIELGNYDVNLTNDFFIEETINNKYQFNTSINFSVTLRFNISILEKLLSRCKPDYIYIIYPNSEELDSLLIIKHNIIEELNKTLDKWNFSKDNIYFALMDFSNDLNIKPLKYFIDGKFANYWISDTFGVLTPHRIALIFDKMKSENISKKINYAVHMHNDLGLALANSLTFVKYGIMQISSSINGIGERAGITNTEQLVVLKSNNRKNIEILRELSKIVVEFSKIKISEIQPIVGDKIKIHTTGIHIDLALKGYKIDKLNDEYNFYMSPFMGKSAWNDFSEKNNIKQYKNNYLLKLLKNSTKALDEQNSNFAWGDYLLDYLKNEE